MLQQVNVYDRVYCSTKSLNHADLSINKEKKIGEKTKGKGTYTLKFSQLEKIPG